MARSPFAVACLSERATHRVLLTALRGRVPPPARDHVMFVPDWAALLEEVGSRPPAVVVFDDEAPGFDVPAVRRLRRALPRAGIVAWLRSSSTNPRLATELATLAIDGFHVAKRRPDPVGLGETIDRARGSAVARRVMRGLGDVVPARLETFFKGLLMASARPVDVSAAAALNFTTPRTLRRYLRNAGLPPPRILITWCRLFHAAPLLANPRRSVLNVALALDFPSADALRTSLRRYVALSPTQVRDRGLDSLVEAFLRRHREGWWGLHGT